MLEFHHLGEGWMRDWEFGDEQSLVESLVTGLCHFFINMLTGSCFNTYGNVSKENVESLSF
jgi:hypothetical protein